MDSETPNLETYTVALLYPDYVAGDFGAEIYVDSATARGWRRAVKAVQLRALRAQVEGTVDDPGDFRPILVLRGEPEVVADATSF